MNVKPANSHNPLESWVTLSLYNCELANINFDSKICLTLLNSTLFSFS